MISKNKVFLGVAAFLAIVLSIVFLGQKGTVVATISESSPIKEMVSVSFSSDKYKKTYPVPGSTRLRPGTYTAIAYSNNSTLFQQEITVRVGKETPLVITLSENPNNDLSDTNPDPETIEKIPHYNLFPRLTGDYRIEALLNEENTQISKLRITVIHHFASPSETELYQNERDIAVAAAQKWLTDNGVENIEQEVIDD